MMPTDDRSTTDRGGRAVPVGATPGATVLFAAWAVGFAIARLTGAAAVVLLLVASFVGILGAFGSGWWRLRSLRIQHVRTASAATVGDSVEVIVDYVDSSSSPAGVSIAAWDTEVESDQQRTERNAGQHDASHPARYPPGRVVISSPMERAGVHTTVPCTVASAGIAGLVMWRRRIDVEIDPLHVAPVAAGPNLAFQQSNGLNDGARTASSGHRHGDLDGTRPWRPGESDQAVHWPSTLRSGDLIAHEREASSESEWQVSFLNDSARLRWTLESGLRRSHRVVICDAPRNDHEQAPHDRNDHAPEHHAPEHHAPEHHASEHMVSNNYEVLDTDDAIRWSARAAERDVVAPTTPVVPWWKRTISLVTARKAQPVPPNARIVVGTAALASMWMLQGALQATSTSRLLALIGVVAATALSLRFSDGTRPVWARVLVIFVAMAALGRIAVQAAGVGGLLAALRGPMPDLLMLLVVLHGAEIADRRTARVHLGLTAVVVAYSAGLRIDGAVGWWMAGWGVLLVWSLVELQRGNLAWGAQRSVRKVGQWASVGVVGTIAVAAFVPVPDGPASLGLPAISNSDAQTNDTGALVGPDGQPAAPQSTAEPSRGALGQAGGYPGFSDTLDTAVRGDLGDEVVMRVRAPEPAFWRGQTFTEFDGRVWRVSDVADVKIEGPEIRIPATIGDVPRNPVATEEFVQTYYVESDQPNVVFAAGRADTVIFDGSVFARQDGAIRADRSLESGTVYSVVSQRVNVTEASLRAQGDLGERFSGAADRPAVSKYLEIPASTSQATLDLAEQLRVEGSTYDTIRAYEAWMAANTSYDLYAPVPDGDAVDDFLFHSQRGFCEQIASSLVVMLRSQGVPSRLATGYIPGTRDRVSGVFEVKASDAHAWVEVWFPESGWEAFDPTAEVPLAGDADRSTVGADATAAIIGGILARPFHLGALIAVGFGAAAALRYARTLMYRRQRGEWGVLHDRFMALAPDELTAPRVADDLALRASTSTSPHEVARVLDRVAFDPGFEPTIEMRDRVTSDIAILERESPVPEPTPA